MKKSSWIFFLSFFIGVIGINLWCKDSAILQDISIYGNTSIVTGQVSGERYFCHIFLLRCRLWIFMLLAERALSAGIIVNGVGCILSAMFGGLIAIAVTANGVVGIFKVILSLFPQWIFYSLAFYLWQKRRMSEERVAGYSYRGKEQLAEMISRGIYWWFVFVIFLLGMLSEGFIQPFFLKKVINL